MEVLIRDRTSATVMAAGSSQNHQYASRIYPSAADEEEHKFVGVEAQRHWHLALAFHPNNSGPRAAFSVEDEPPDGVESRQAGLGK